MNSNDDPHVEIPLLLVADVQDSILVVIHDLKRLDMLLEHTMNNLMERFTSVSSFLSHAELQLIPELEAVRKILHSAVT
jgi:hypothetical protein